MVFFLICSREGSIISRVSVVMRSGEVALFYFCSIRVEKSALGREAPIVLAGTVGKSCYILRSCFFFSAKKSAAHSALKLVKRARKLEQERSKRVGFEGVNITLSFFFFEDSGFCCFAFFAFLPSFPSSFLVIVVG